MTLDGAFIQLKVPIITDDGKLVNIIHFRRTGGSRRAYFGSLAENGQWISSGPSADYRFADHAYEISINLNSIMGRTEAAKYMNINFAQKTVFCPEQIREGQRTGHIRRTKNNEVKYSTISDGFKPLQVVSRFDFLYKDRWWLSSNARFDQPLPTFLNKCSGLFK